MSVHSRSDGKGYLLIRADPEDHSGVGRRYVAVHRLAALAWGEIEEISEPLEIHHRDRTPWHNSEGNLQALPPEQHGRVTRTQAAPAESR